MALSEPHCCTQPTVTHPRHTSSYPRSVLDPSHTAPSRHVPSHPTASRPIPSHQILSQLVPLYVRRPNQPSGGRQLHPSRPLRLRWQDLRTVWVRRFPTKQKAKRNETKQNTTNPRAYVAETKKVCSVNWVCPTRVDSHSSV